jgi:hypothetical protein
VAVIGRLNMVSVWSGILIGPDVAIRFDGQSPPGNAEPWLAYRFTVTGCPVPSLEVACSIPNSTDVIS